MKNLYRIALFLMCAMLLGGCESRSYFEEQKRDEAAEDSVAAGTSDDDTASADGRSADGTDSGSDGSRGTERSSVSGADDADSANGGSESTGESANAAGTDTASAKIYVDVAGAVAAPGVYLLPQGSRVFQAIDAAGGLTADADLSDINRAGPVSDGEKLYIYAVGEERPAVVTDGTALSTGGDVSGSGTGSINGTGGIGQGTGASAPGLTADGRIDLNTATREQLMTLPGIGGQKADAIISYREAHGGFAAPEEIKNISGIKDGVYQKIADLIGIG